MSWPFVTRRERLRREAADWIARLNGPHDARDRAEFERWYASSPDRARTYDRIAARFDLAAQASPPEVAEARRRPARGGTPPLRYAFAAAAVACAVLLAFFLLSARTVSPLSQPLEQFAAFEAASESRRILLADGSTVILSAGSALEAALGERERRLTLVRGEARFSVRRDPRPFIVVAQGTEVVARGTEFVVSVAQGRTTVSLIEGRVDVAYTLPREAGGERRVARLRPGESLTVGPGEDVSTAALSQEPAVPPATRSRRAAMLEFDDTPLSEAVEQINRRGGATIRLADASLTGLRVTGAFRADDAEGFALSVAAAFGLEVEEPRDGNLLIRQPRSGRRE